ncbi:hypothetical protein [Dactylosporangium sp. CS-033363]|uniref:hypothetical protein n=1 Tax=Dactylosporangium sp. CS-033363 TaxID=3239935 RepID=UPI003D8D266C
MSGFKALLHGLYVAAGRPSFATVAADAHALAARYGVAHGPTRTAIGAMLRVDAGLPSEDYAVLVAAALSRTAGRDPDESARAIRVAWKSAHAAARTLRGRRPGVPISEAGLPLPPEAGLPLPPEAGLPLPPEAGLPLPPGAVHAAPTDPATAPHPRAAGSSRRLHDESAGRTAPHPRAAGSSHRLHDESAGRTAPHPRAAGSSHRLHDESAGRIVDAVRGGASRVMALVGVPGSGRFRTAAQAVRTLPDLWRIWSPPDGDLAAAGPYTVVWPADAAPRLHADPDLGRTGLLAAVRSLVTDPARAPVLVVLPVWPDDWGRLTAPPLPGTTDGHDDLRAILHDAAVAVPPPDGKPKATDSAEVDAVVDAWRFGASEPALAEAVLYAGAVRRAAVFPDAAFWKQLGAAGDWHTVGVQAERRGRFARAAEAYRRAAEPRSFSALSLLRDRAGDHAEADRLAIAAAGLGDGTALRRLIARGDLRRAETLAQALDDDPDLLCALADRHAGTDRAEAWYRAAAEQGSTEAAIALVRILFDRGDPAEAERYAHRAADGDDTRGLRNLADLHRRSGSPEAAERLAIAAATRGHAAEQRVLREERLRLGKPGAVAALRRRAEDTADPGELHRLDACRAVSITRALAMALRLACRRHTGPLRTLSVDRHRRGDRADGLRLAVIAARAGDPSVLAEIAVLTASAEDQFATARPADRHPSTRSAESATAARPQEHDTSRTAEHHTIDPISERAITGRPRELDTTSRERHASAGLGERGTAARSDERAGAARSREPHTIGRTGAQDGAAQSRERHSIGRTGGQDGAAQARERHTIGRTGARDGGAQSGELLAERAALLGDGSALRRLARARRLRGDVDGAGRLLERAVAAGDADALFDLARIVEWAGDAEGAEVRYREAARRGVAGAADALARLLQDREPAAAAAYARRAVELGHATALHELGRARERGGDAEGAAALYRMAGDDTAARLLAELWEREQQADAVALATEAAESGFPAVLRHLAALRAADGDALLWAAYEHGDAEVLPLLPHLRAEDDGRHARAERLALDAAQQGHTRAVSDLCAVRALTGDLAGAERLALRARTAGLAVDVRALVAGRLSSEEAAPVTVLRLYDEAGAHLVLARAADEHAAAVARCVLAANLGDPAAVPELIRLHRRRGDHVTADMIERYGLDDDGGPARAW